MTQRSNLFHAIIYTLLLTLLALSVTLNGLFISGDVRLEYDKIKLAKETEELFNHVDTDIKKPAKH